MTTTGAPRRAVLEERRRHGVGHAPRLDEVLDLNTRALGHLEERTERPWCRERVAPAPEDGRPDRELVAEPTYEGCLTDAGLAADEDEAPMTGRGVCKRLTQVRERLFALDEDVGRR